MPDAARKWLERKESVMAHVIIYDDGEPPKREALETDDMRHIRRLLELNEQLEATNAAQAQTIKAAHIRTLEVSTRYNDCQQQVEGLETELAIARELHGHHREILDELEADRTALVAYLRAFRKSMVDKFPLLCSYGKSYSKDDEAWQELSEELRGEIDA